MTSQTLITTRQREASGRRMWPHRVRPVRPPEGLRVDVRYAGPAAVIRLTGSAGMLEGGQLARALEGATSRRPPVIVLDLGGLDFIGSCGLAAVLGGLHLCRLYGGELRLASPRAPVLGVLERMALTRLLPVYPTVEDAVRAPAGHRAYGSGASGPRIVHGQGWTLWSRRPLAPCGAKE